MAGNGHQGADEEMIASNVAKSREASCVECGVKIDGGRYCDACLPANQTELEEQFDREHPVASGGAVDADDDARSEEMDFVTCPKCNREVRPKNADEKIRKGLYKHLYSLHSGSLSTREMLNMLDELTPSDSSGLPDDAEWERSLEDIEKSLTHDRKESAPQQGNSEDEHMAAAEKQPSSDKQESMRRVATVMRLQGESQTVRQLKRIIREECPGRQPGRIITLMLQSGMIEQDPAVGYRCYRVAAVDPERHAAQVAARASEQRTVHCPLAGCSWMSSPGEPSILKRRLSDHLFANKAHVSLSSEERIAHLNREFPGVSWPKSKSGKRQTAVNESEQRVQERVITCPCGSVMTASSPKTKLDVLVRVHVKSGLHKSLNEMQRYELMVKMLPSHKWKVPLGYVTWSKESGSTPISVHQAVHQDQPAAAISPAPQAMGASSPLSAHQASSHKTLLLLDGTNGFSFAGSGAFLERTLKPFLESRALRVEITDTGELLRMTMEMRKEEKA